MDLGPDDIGYVCMPLFHSNAVQVGWAPSIVVGALGRPRPASSRRRAGCPTIRRYGSTYFNYTGKPLAYLLAQPERPDDADNPLRVAFGNEGSPRGRRRVRPPLRRRGDRRVRRDRRRRRGQPRRRAARRRARARGPTTCKVVDDDGNEKPVAEFDADGRLLNADECVGEIVNTGGVGPFEGYYNNAEATAKTTRFGWYWSGDLGYKDADDYLYFAGRNADWIRVDGENFPAGPIEETLRDASRRRARRGLRRARRPGRRPGDGRARARATARRSTRPGSRAWLDAQADIGPKWRPRYVRVMRRAADHGHEQDREAHARAPEVPRRPRRRRPGVRPRPRTSRRTARSPPPTRTRCTRRSCAYGRERFWDL